MTRVGWCVCVLVVSACASGRSGGAPSVDAAAVVQRPGPRELSCAHCHADRQQLQAGRISPGPAWPGVGERTVLRGRAQPLEAAVRSCATDHAGLVLSDAEVRAVTSWVRAQGPALPGQVTPDRAREPRSREDILALDVMAGDAWRGEALFPRACGACHGDAGPSYDLPTLRSQAPREVLLKVLGAPQPGDTMPFFGAGTLSDQDALDLAVWVGGQG